VQLADLGFDPATEAELQAHLTDPSSAHVASAIGFTPTGSIGSGDVQAAIAEVASEAASALAASDSTNATNLTNAISAHANLNLTAQLASTANLTRSGEQVIDGVLSAASRVLLKNQTAAADNGLYVTGTGAWVRTTDFDTAAELPLNTNLKVYIIGGGQAGTVWAMTNTAAITLNTTALTFAQIGGPANPAAGIAGLRSLGSGATQATAGDDNRLPAQVSLLSLAAASVITCTRPTQYIQGGAGAITLSDAKWLADGTFTGQRCSLKGSSAANTVTGPTTATIKHCGGSGSVVIGLNKESPGYTWTGSLWQQDDCPSLQRAANVDNTIDLTGTQLRLREGTSGFDFKVVSGQPTMEALCAGGFCDQIINIQTGKSFFMQLAGTQIESISSAGVQTYSGAGRPRATLYWDAGAIRPDGTQCVAVGPTVNSGPSIDGITCTENAAAKLSVKVRLPDRYTGADLYCRLVAHDVDSLGHVSGWDARAQCRTPGTDTINATWGTAVAMNVTMTTANIPYSSAEATITPNGGCLGGDMLYLELNMNTTANTDDNDAVIEGLTCEYLASSRSD